MDYDEVLGSVYNPAWQALDPPQRCQRTLDALKHLLLREIGQASPGTIRAVLAARDRVASEPELTPDVVAQLRTRLAAPASDETPAG